jgi:hypothetical protein
MAKKSAVESERTTTELIEVLGNDVDRCFQGWSDSVDKGTRHEDGTIEADHEYHARQFIRAVFAFIEALTFSMKVKAAELCMRNRIPIMDAERFLACDIEYALSDRGEVYERAAHIKLADNIRFAFALQEKALKLATKFDANVEWWSCLKAAIKVRDRLTHPKMPEHVDVSGDELHTVVKAFNGFKEQAVLYADARKGRGSSKKRRKSGSKT